MSILKPDMYFKSIYDINFEKLYVKGIRAIICDIDNTLVEHGKGSNVNIKNLFNKLLDMGFKIGFLSNNSKDRIEIFNTDFGFQYIAKAKKPLPANYKKMAKNLGYKINKCIFIGDQLFTDILGANMAGMMSILLTPISNCEPRQIRIKRKIEKIFMRGKYEYTRQD